MDWFLYNKDHRHERADCEMIYGLTEVTAKGTSHKKITRKIPLKDAFLE